ncbi:DUF6542 domain-containing protein [Streptomyces sp. NPDC020875]|uniref:DUF6542 domain-containing protein n=1 Tax=Streptomyces sp. NPDC020875 TaxID=3154898 RepID=UPI0033FD2E55
MDQPRTSHPQRRQRPQAPVSQGPLSPQSALADRPVLYGVRPARPAPLAQVLRRLPAPRLTGLGAGLFAVVTMVLLGFAARLLLDSSAVVYGVLFLPVSALTALWVREADLVTAPIGVPIAFAAGVVPIAGGEGGLGGQVMAVVTALAVHAGWLYGGTLVAGVIASVRKVRRIRRRKRRTGGAVPPTARR